MRTVLILAASLILGACATLAQGRDERVGLVSDPPGASAGVVCDGAPTATVTTSATVTLPRKALQCTVTFSMEGYGPRTFLLDRKVSEVLWLDVLPGVALGAAWSAAVGVSDLLCEYDCESGDSNLASLAGMALGSGVSVLVDYGTGAAYTHGQKEIVVKLEALP